MRTRRKKKKLKTGFCLHFQVEPTQMGAIERARLLVADRAMDNVQNCDSYVLLKHAGYEVFTLVVM
jgi:hypothetical protein